MQPARITRRIGDAIKRQIASGTLGAGGPLPSTRALAAEWGVSRTTVTAAYDQLIAEGFLEARQGARTVVAHALVPPPAPSTVEAPPVTPGRLSAYADRLAAFASPATGPAAPVRVDFRYGDLAAADFPMLTWKKAIAAALLRQPSRLRYGDPQGSPELRGALQAYLWRARGLRCEPEQIVVVNGAQQGLDLCSRLLLDPGDSIAVENPGYTLARQTFLAAGATLLPVAVDRDGMQTGALPAARMAYVTPSHQFPLGGVLSAVRRRELLAWAQRGGAYILEDDYDGEYRFNIAPIPPLQALDTSGRVLYLGTVSKTLSPTLRLGYLVVPAALVETFVTAKRLADRHAPGLEQDALAALLAVGAYDRHIRRVRRRNAERRAALLAALSSTLGQAVTVSGADAGLHIVVCLNQVPVGWEQALIRQARAIGLGLYPAGPLYAPPPALQPDRAALVMGYASLDEHQIRQGVQMLAGVLERFRAQATPEPSRSG